jgi:hypothetical protein
VQPSPRCRKACSVLAGDPVLGGVVRAAAAVIGIALTLDGWVFDEAPTSRVNVTRLAASRRHPSLL